MSKHLPLLISAVVGAGTWVGIGTWSGTKEAWDSPLYWSVGFPLMLIAVLLIALKWPEKPGGCGMTVMVAQAFVGFTQAFPHVTLWPFSLLLLLVLSLPLVLAASLGSIIRKRFIDHESA
ncbi:hypothetical protein KAR91_13265 [Candidatus Pacearchaeota archaeon]|nr:hypothetical protein [Candidatus Pacearchaeota archaeon]